MFQVINWRWEWPIILVAVLSSLAAACSRTEPTPTVPPTAFIPPTAAAPRNISADALVILGANQLKPFPIKLIPSGQSVPKEEAAALWTEFLEDSFVLAGTDTIFRFCATGRGGQESGPNADELRSFGWEVVYGVGDSWDQPRLTMRTRPGADGLMQAILGPPNDDGELRWQGIGGRNSGDQLLIGALTEVYSTDGCSKLTANSPTPSPAPTLARPTATPTLASTNTIQTPTPVPSDTRQTSELKVARGFIGPINALRFNGGRTGFHVEMGYEENLFWGKDGNPMAPLLATSWSINPDGSKAHVNIKDGIPWYAPHAQSNLDLGFFSAHDVALWMNLVNLRTNPSSLQTNGADFAAVYGEARALDDLTLEIDLVEPLIFALPLLSEYAAYGGGRFGPTFVKGIELFGEEWTNANPVGTGTYVIGECVTEERCEFHAVQDHWRQTASIDQITNIQANRDTAISLLLNGQIDISFHLHNGQLREHVKSGLKFIQTNGYSGQSVAWSGNLWEEFHGQTGEPLEPWLSPAYEVDYPWIGDPWQVLHPELVAYEDTNNPDGMTDMEQARLVRLALSIALDRSEMIDGLLQGYGIPLYSEYMGPEYEGWDPGRTTATWTFDGIKVDPTGTNAGVPWQLSDGDLQEADRLLTLAGYPLIDGARQGFEMGLRVNMGGFGEIGVPNLTGVDKINHTWGQLGIPIIANPENPFSEYQQVIAPRMRERRQFHPVFKNGDIDSNLYPIDYPYPPFDTSLTGRGYGGLGIGFESPFLVQQLLTIQSEPNRAKRAQMHLDTADYMLFWQLYSGVFQVPKGFVTSQRVKEIGGPTVHLLEWSLHPEFIVLED